MPSHKFVVAMPAMYLTLQTSPLEIQATISNLLKTSEALQMKIPQKFFNFGTKFSKVAFQLQKKNLKMNFPVNFKKANKACEVSSVLHLAKWSSCVSGSYLTLI